MVSECFEIITCLQFIIKSGLSQGCINCTVGMMLLNSPAAYNKENCTYNM